MQYQLPINLDTLSCDPDDYSAFVDWLETQKGVGVKSKKLLREYAVTCQRSMLFRLTGCMLQARYHEEKLQEIYKKISKKYQW